MTHEAWLDDAEYQAKRLRIQQNRSPYALAMYEVGAEDGVAADRRALRQAIEALRQHAPSVEPTEQEMDVALYFYAVALDDVLALIPVDGN